MEDMMKNFEDRMAAKKAAKPKLHRFEAEFRISVLSPDEEHAAETVKVIAQHLVRFDDIETAEGVLK